MGFESNSLKEKLTFANLVAGLIHVIVDHGWAPDTAALNPCFPVRPVKMVQNFRHYHSFTKSSLAIFGHSTGLPQKTS